MESVSCDSMWEYWYFVISMLMIVMVFISGTIVFLNADEKSPSLSFDILGFLHLFFSSKGLNPIGKKWRWVFLVSLTYVILSLIVSGKLDICR